MPIRECPMRFLDRWSSKAIQDWQLLQLGILPSPGGWDDQASSFCQAMLTLAAEFSAIDEDERKERK